MSASRKKTARDELDQIEDAVIESIMEAGEKELREEIVEAGGDPAVYIAAIDSAIGRAKSASAKKRLETAKEKMAVFRSAARQPSAAEREVARIRLQSARAGDRDAARIMLAARKGEGLSDRDFDGLVEDIAELERLEREDAEE